MKSILSHIISFLLIVTAASAATMPKQEVNFSGNGETVVESSQTAKPLLSVYHKSLFQMFEISLPESHIEAFKSDVSTGEMASTILNSKCRFEQRIFSSRSDDALVILLTSDGDQPINQKIKFHAPTNRGKKQDFSTRTQFTAVADGIEIHSAFNKPVADGDKNLYGSESFVKVVADGGKLAITNDEITLTKCSQLLLVITSKPLLSLANPALEELRKNADNIVSGVTETTTSKKSKNKSSIAYNTLFKRNIPFHNAACKTVSLTLKTGNNIDTEIGNLYNSLYYKGICYGNIQNIEQDNFSALPKLSNLTKAQIQSSFYFDYYLYTLDTDFLRDKVLPYMMTTYDALEKTLKATDDFGFYVIAKDCPTIDVTASIFFLRDLVTACNVLMEHQEKVTRMQEMLAKLPPFKIDINEDFRRNLYGDIANKTDYTEVSHLLGLFYRNDPIITRNYDIREACRTSIETCLANRKQQNLKGIDMGFLQLALSSAALGDSKTTYRLLCDARQDWDKAGSRELVPIIKKMLVQSYYSPESSRTYLNILPATPDDWTNGELTGMPVRGGLTIQELTWDESGEIRATIESRTDMKLDVYVRGHFIKQFDLTPGTTETITVRKK